MPDGAAEPTTPRKSCAAPDRVATPCRNATPPPMADALAGGEGGDDLDHMSCDDLQILFVKMDS